MFTMGRLTIAAGMVAAVLLLDGCGADVPGGHMSDGEWLYEAGLDLNCEGGAQWGKNGVQYHDIDGDGNEDTILDMVCPPGDYPANQGERVPDQVEVYRGRNSASHHSLMKRLTRVTDRKEKLVSLNKGCLYFSRGHVLIVGQNGSSSTGISGWSATYLGKDKFDLKNITSKDVPKPIAEACD